MSLNRQRILSELGSVMNQLKSADCGCMGKLFANQNQAPGGEMGAPLPTCGGCRRGVCHGHGYSQGYGQVAPCAGEPYSMGNSMNQPCMGHCNPSKLYAETYNYLNHNLMQPVMKEVYEDLKSINPENTLMNNPLGKEMGLSGNSGGMTPGNSGNMNIGHVMSGMGSTNVNAQMGQSQPPMDPTSGMGPQIVNMVMGDSGTKSSNVQRIPQQDGQATGAMANASQSVPGEVSGMNMPKGFSQGQYNSNIQGNTTGFANPPTQFVSKDNMYLTENAHSNPVMDAQNNPVMGGTMSQGAVQPIGASMSNDNNNNSSLVSGNMHGMVIANPAVPQMPTINKLQYGQQAQGMMQNTNSVVQQPPQGSKPQYGHHTQGMMKFNEMFPGVTQGGDLGFDPMAIAIQMNPANKQHAAMDTMHRLMNGGPAGRAMDTAGNASINQLTNIPLPDAQIQQNLANVNQTGNQQLISQGQQQVPAQQNLPPIQTMNQQMVPLGQQQAINANAAAFPPQPNAMQQQQVYSTVTGQPMINQQQYQQQQLQKQMQVCQQQPPDPTQQYQQQQYSDPNTGTTLPAGQRIVDLNAQAQQSPTQAAPKSNMPQEMTKDPIFPADVSRNQPYTYPKAQQRYYDYNTLGQPVEMLPAKMFHPQEPPLPQTLSPQPPSTKLRNDYLRYSNVKSTVSKTSLAGVKPIGRTPSRSQLQHIYNQYKGSQSFTQQNVRPPVQGGSFSEGKLNVPSASAHPAQQVPVERVGGDTHANNQIVNNQTNKVEQVMGQIGDVPVTTNKPHGDAPIKPPGSPVPQRHAKLRNGLQDVVYTSYPSSAAWSFHGAHTYRPISVGYRFRNLK